MSTNKHRDVAIIGYYGWGNFGDDLLADYVLDLVCRTIPPDRVLVRGPEGNYLERWFPGVRCRPGKEIFRSGSYAVRKVIFGGGGQFFAFPPATFMNLWGLRKCKAYGRWRMIGWSRWRQLSAYAFCIGVGPLEGAGARWMTRKFLGRCEHISVRDAVSKALLSGIRNVRVVADPSIGLAATLSPISQPDPKTVGIVVRRWTRGPSVAELIVSLQSAAQSLRNLGWTVQFISFQASDREVTQWLRNNGEIVRDWRPQCQTIPEFCLYLSGFQVLITMRVHGVFVGSLLGAVPVAVRIEPKLEISAAKCGCLDYVIGVETSPAEVITMVERASEAGPILHNWQDDLQALELESNRLRDWLRT
jgi:polysaccharide pyruvyl transferase WcaK-like protein